MTRRRRNLGQPPTSHIRANQSYRDGPSPASTPPNNRRSPAPGRRRQDHLGHQAPAPASTPPILPVSLPVINPSPPPPPPPPSSPSPPVDSPMIDPAPPADCSLLDPVSVPYGIQLDSCATADSAAIVSAHTSGGLKVSFCFESSGGTLALHTRCEETSDPYPCSTRPIKILSEIICSHYQLVLLRVCTTAINSPRDFFVYSFPYSMRADVSIHRIPKFVPKSSAVSQSFGLLRDESDCDNYVVANLEMLNPKKEYVQVLLHRWWPSSESWFTTFLGKVTLASIIDMRKWQTDQVIPYLKDLLWADLKQGILFCFKNSLNKNTSLRIIYLPLMKKVQRPETFMSVGCCNGKLKFVHLDISDFSEVVTIMTFSESSYEKKELCWHRTSRIYLNCTELWATMPSDLKFSEYYMPCFPVLHTGKDNILYLTIFKKDKDNKRAWLLRLDMKARKDSSGASPHQPDAESDTSTDLDTQFSTDSYTSTESSMEYWAQVGVIDYPGFCRHPKPPLILPHV